MWSWLATLIGGPAVTGLINAYKAKLDASNTLDRIVADLAAKEIEAEIDARRQANALLIAEQGRLYTVIFRPLLAAPVIIYLWKVIVWDKVLGLGTTNPLGGAVAEWAGLIVTTYVGGRTIEKVVRIFARSPWPTRSCCASGSENSKCRLSTSARSSSCWSRSLASLFDVEQHKIDYKMAMINVYSRNFPANLTFS